MTEKTVDAKSKKTRFILPCCVVLVLGYLLIANGTAIEDYIVGLGYDPSEEIATMVSELELTNAGMRIMKASLPEVQQAETFNDNCSSEDTDTSVLGCYNQHKIYIFSVENEELNGVKQSTLAHELLHAVWERYQNDELATDLLTVYEQNRDTLDEHMSHYDEASKVDELHSVIGTQLDESKLTPRLIEHYQRFFQNQAKIVEYYNNYEEKFTALQSRNDALKEQIDDLTSEIQLLSDQYEKDADQLNHDIDTFNSRARNGYYSSNAVFTADRNVLLARQDQLGRDYEQIELKVDEVNELIEEYNANVNHSNELYSSINSKISAPEEALGE